eukprot:g5059.t1
MASSKVHDDVAVQRKKSDIKRHPFARTLYVRKSKGRSKRHLQKTKLTKKLKSSTIENWKQDAHEWAQESLGIEEDEEVFAGENWGGHDAHDDHGAAQTWKQRPQDAAAAEVCERHAFIVKTHPDTAPATMMSPSFLGVPRARAPRRIPDFIRTLKEKGEIALKRESGNVIRNRIGRVRSFDDGGWHGGYGASEFSLRCVMDKDDEEGLAGEAQRQSQLQLSEEMRTSLSNRLISDIGAGVWDDTVGSRAARELDASIFCSREYQDLQPGRVFRGYLHGRRRRARRIFWALCTLQRICRGFCGRLRALEKLRFRSAAHVQKLVRGHRGRKYARQKRADMIEAERKRRSGEQEMERIAEMDARMKLKTLLKSKSGKKELRAVMTKLREEHRRRKKEYALMTPMQRERRDVENIFRKYDADRSGSIDKAEFAILLRDLCIPLRPAELERTMLLVDTDGSGTIEFDEFFFWYTTEASGTYSLVSTSQGAASARELQFAKARLRARKVARDIIGYSLKAEAVRYLEAEKMKHAKRRAARAYRLRPGRRPNFACRKCLEPFVFSFDLEKHPKNCLEIDVYHDMQERAEAEHAAQEKEKELQRKGAAAEENDRRAARQRAYG